MVSCMAAQYHDIESTDLGATAVATGSGDMSQIYEIINNYRSHSASRALLLNQAAFMTWLRTQTARREP
jgi:hypothetical protein